MALASQTATIFGTTNNAKSLARNAAIQEATPTTEELARCLFDCIACLPLEVCALIAASRGRVVPPQFCVLPPIQPRDTYVAITVRDGRFRKKRRVFQGKVIRDASVVYWHWDVMYVCVVGPRGSCVYAVQSATIGDACGLLIHVLPEFQSYRRGGSATSASASHSATIEPLNDPLNK